MDNHNSQVSDVNENNSALGYGDMNPYTEDAYWRDNHINASYYNKDYTYDNDYKHAYATGYEGRLSHQSDANFDSVESDLERTWNQKKGHSKMAWSEARQAVSDAWNRFSR